MEAVVRRRPPVSRERRPDDLVARVAALLGDAREDAGLSQAAAARALGVAQSRVAKLELGQRQLLFVEAIALCDLYGVNLDRLDPGKTRARPRSGRRMRIDSAKRVRTDTSGTL